MAQSKVPRVAVLVDTSTDWGRRLIRGVVGYVRKHGPWDLWVDARGQNEPMRLPPGWRGDGIIARVSDHHTARHVGDARLPAINVSGIELRGVRFCRVTTDLRKVGRLAAEHLRDRGLMHFAYATVLRLGYVQHQYQGFVDALAEADCRCSNYHPSFQSNSRQGWEAQEQELGQWLTPLPKPVGILAWGTTLGRQLIESCHRFGLRVPEDVAVIGGDYDELLCETCTPALSGVAVPSEQLGHEAALQLDRLMHGALAVSIQIPPQGVVARQSTDLLAVEDEDLALAIRFIRDHAAQPIEVEDVVREVAISRRRLERGFHKVLGRSPLAEIRRQHLAAAKRLLAETDLPIPDVAAAAGFGAPTHFALIFKRETGLSPLKYRTATRAR